MKRKLFWMSLLLLTIAGLSSCSSNDDDEVAAGIDDVCGGVVYNGYAIRQFDKANPLSVFFAEELHEPTWDDEGNIHKSFFERGEWNDERVLVINSQEEFQTAYMGTKTLPDVDFGQYTLVIGKTWGSSSSQVLRSVILRDLGYAYELETQLVDLETQLVDHIDYASTCAIQTIFYWHLYPKLPKKPIMLKRTVTYVHD